MHDCTFKFKKAGLFEGSFFWGGSNIIFSYFLKSWSNIKIIYNCLTTHLTHFMPLISFDTPWKHQNTSGFLIFSGGIKRDQWHAWNELKGVEGKKMTTLSVTCWRQKVSKKFKKMIKIANIEEEILNIFWTT